MHLRLTMLALSVAVASGSASARELPIAELGGPDYVTPSPSYRTGGADVKALEAAPGTKTPSVRLVWLDPADVAFGTEGFARSEVVRLLQDMGIAATWRRGEAAELSRPGEVRVIFLDRGAQREHGTPVLGATPTSFATEPYVWIHVPSVRAAAGVGGQRGGAWPDMRTARMFGIALARVIAHELVHALAPTLPHGAGLMAPRLDRAMLTATRIAVDPEVAIALRTALIVPARATGPGESVLAAEGNSKEPKP
jgi:hypothetical protein